MCHGRSPVEMCILICVHFRQAHAKHMLILMKHMQPIASVEKSNSTRILLLELHNSKVHMSSTMLYLPVQKLAKARVTGLVMTCQIYIL